MNFSQDVELHKAVLNLLSLKQVETRYNETFDLESEQLILELAGLDFYRTTEVNRGKISLFNEMFYLSADNYWLLKPQHIAPMWGYVTDAFADNDPTHDYSSLFRLVYKARDNTGGELQLEEEKRYPNYITDVDNL